MCVYVSDNASTDDTEKLVKEFQERQLKVRYFRQSENVGFDNNLRFLYQIADSGYVWFIADDDMPLPGAISTILNIIDAQMPDVLLFSFVQPPGSKVRQFDYADPLRIVTDPVEAIEHVLRYTKLSIFVLRKIAFAERQWQELDRNIGAGWYYISLAFSVLESGHFLKLIAVSDPLATCDEGFTELSWTPTPFLNLDKPVQHAFVLKNYAETNRRYPRLLKYFNEEGYYGAIQCAFSVKCGGLSSQASIDYDGFIRDLDCRGLMLIKRPKALIQFLALKLRIAGVWSYVRPAFRRKASLL